MQAISILKDVVEADPLDLGANAMLAEAYIDAGQHGLYLKQRDRLDGLEKRDPFDDLLWGQAVMHGDLDQGLTILDATIKESPSAIGLAIRSHGRMKLYWHEWDQVLLEQAMQDLYAAKSLIPDNPFVIVLEFYAYFEPALRGELSEPDRSKMQAAAERMSGFEEYAHALHATAMYQDYLDEPAKALHAWEQLHKDHPGTWMDLYFAASRFRLGDENRALDILNVDSSSMINLLYRGELLALLGREQEAKRVYSQLVEHMSVSAIAPGPDDVWGIPESILLLLGDQPAASEAATKRQAAASEKERRLLEFIGDVGASEVELLESAKLTSQRTSANKLIAFRLLGQGKTAEAKEYLAKCQAAFPMAPEAYWAEAVVRHLERANKPSASRSSP